MMSRGMLTEEVQKVAVEGFGHEISIAQLRLIPYLVYVATNGGVIESRKVNDNERQIIRDWEDHRLLEYSVGNLYVSEKFWEVANRILFIAYVELKLSPTPELPSETPGDKL